MIKIVCQDDTDRFRRCWFIVSYTIRSNIGVVPMQKWYVHNNNLLHETASIVKIVYY